MQTETHPYLQRLRQRTDLKLKPLRHLRKTFHHYDGEEQELRVRYYQVQGAMHLLAMTRFVLGDDCGIGKCVVGSTLVRTNRGLARIEDLNPGIRTHGTFAPVRGLEVQLGRERLPVKSFYYGGTKPTVSIRTRHGFELEGTRAHPILTRREGGTQFVKMPDLRVGDYVCLDRSDQFQGEDSFLPEAGEGAPNELKYPTPKRMSPDFARFLGYLIGEGWFNHKHSFHISQDEEKNPEVSNDIQACLTLLFDYPVKGNSEKNILCTVSSTYLIRFLCRCGVNFGVSQDRTVPGVILKSSRESVRNFLAALVDSESHVTKNGIEFSSASEELTRQVQLLLLSFGVVSRRSRKMVKGREENYWRLCILGENARRYRDRIGFISRRKEAAFEANRSGGTNLDVIPFAIEEIRSLYEELKRSSRPDGVRQFGNGFGIGMREVLRGIRGLTYDKLAKLVELGERYSLDTSGARSLLNQGFFYDRIVSIEEGVNEVFDLEVDDDRHAFWGNGFVNHNTLQALTALCCLWEKDPSIKAVILTTKSSVPEWQDEFVKFTSGIRVYRVPDLAALAPKKRPPLTAEKRAFFSELFGEGYFDAMKVPEPKVKKGGKGKKPDLLELLEASAMSPGEIAKRKVELSDEEKKEKKKREKEEKDRKAFLDSICQLWLVAKDIEDKGLRSLVEDVGKRLARGAPVSSESEQRLSEALKEHRVVKIPASDRRAEVYREFAEAEGPAAIVMNYRKAVIDYDAVRPMVDGAVLIFDECTAFKNHRADVHKACRHLADLSSRAWGMTATLIQNRLMEGFGVYRVIKPDLFKTVSGFHGRYCIVQMQRVKGNRKIPLVVGHSRAQIEDFRKTIDPYFLGRAKHEVASELPAVITKIVRVGLSKPQQVLYNEALGEILEVIKAGEAEYKEMDELTRVTYCQEIVDHPGLIGHSGGSEKLDRLMDLVSEGDFAEHQIVVFSRFKSMVNIIEDELTRRKISSVRITGDEDERQRKAAMAKFRKANSDVRVALITTAGSMAINLQTAAAFIFFDTPWSAGDWIQAFGRIDRIGSKHSSIYCVHLIAKDTIDDRIIARIRAKRRLIEAALGKVVLRDKDGDFQVSAENDIKELFQDLVEDAKRLRRR